MLLRSHAQWNQSTNAANPIDPKWPPTERGWRKASNDKITYKQTKRLQLPEGITFAPVIHETSSLFRHHFKLKARCKKMKIGLEELLTNDAAIYLHTASTTVD